MAANPAFRLLTELLDSLPRDHPERPGVIRSIEVLRHDLPGDEARCPHGSSLATICPYCDHHGFLVAYAKTRNVIERMGWSDEDIERIVQEVEASRPEPG